ncbi:MAG: primosomal protein N', partial [Sedimenticolaceae bacterium]
MTARIARVAVATPLYSLFDYLIPADVDVVAGSRVRVPFGRTRPIGVVVMVVGNSECPAGKLKPIEAVLDPGPLLQQDDLDFLTWAAGYYHHPPGEVVVAALPLRLRKNGSALSPGGPAWRLTPAGRA